MKYFKKNQQLRNEHDNEKFKLWRKLFNNVAISLGVKSKDLPRLAEENPEMYDEVYKELGIIIGANKLENYNTRSAQKIAEITALNSIIKGGGRKTRKTKNKRKV